MAFRYSAYNTTIFNCPCPCCSTWKECRTIAPSICQMMLDSCVDNYEAKSKTKYSGTKKSKVIREKLEEDAKDIEKLILDLSENGGKNENNTLVFFISRYTYIKELLEKYWKDEGKR